MAFRSAAKLREFLGGDLTIFGGPEISGIAAGRVRAEQISTIREYLPWMMLANAFNAVILVAALWRSTEQPLALGWASLVIGFAALHGGRLRPASLPSVTSERTIRRAASRAFVLGSLWAAVPVLFFNTASNTGQLVITCLCAGMLGGGALAFASVPVAAMAFAIPIIFGSGIAIAQNDELAYLLIAMLMIVYACVLIRSVFAHAFGLIGRVMAQLNAEEQARTDSLTQLPNRVYFHHELERVLARVGRYGEHFALIYLDVDKFKAVNDELGHSGGDKLLVKMAERLRACVREVDFICRLGGDEFAIIAEGVSGPRDAAAIAERVARATQPPFVIDGARLSKSVSIGVAIAPFDGNDSGALLNKADQAMYRAKSDIARSVRFANLQYDVYVEEHRTCMRPSSGQLDSACISRNGMDPDLRKVFELNNRRSA